MTETRAITRLEFAVLSFLLMMVLPQPGQAQSSSQVNGVCAEVVCPKGSPGYPHVPCRNAHPTDEEMAQWCGIGSQSSGQQRVVLTPGRAALVGGIAGGITGALIADSVNASKTTNNLYGTQTSTQSRETIAAGAALGAAAVATLCFLAAKAKEHGNNFVPGESSVRVPTVPGLVVSVFRSLIHKIRRQ
jgi:hypothetical protein